MEENVIPNWIGTKIISTHRTEYQIRVAESLIIHLTKNENMNGNEPVDISFPWRELLKISMSKEC